MNPQHIIDPESKMSTYNEFAQKWTTAALKARYGLDFTGDPVSRSKCVGAMWEHKLLFLREVASEEARKIQETPLPPRDRHEPGMGEILKRDYALGSDRN